MVACLLCEKTVKYLHERSHLVPEWMYRDCYDEKHKMVNVELHKGFVNKRQKGIYRRIICEECEKISQLYDRYGSLVLTTRSPEAPEHKLVIKKDFFDDRGKITHSFWENIDFRNLQRFILISILRTHIAQKKEGKYLLNDKHFKKMRELYTGQAIIDDSSYPVMITKYVGEDSKGLVYHPFVNKRDGHHFIEFSGAGYRFSVIVSSHKKPSYVNSMCLKKNGSIYIASISLEECGIFKSAALKFVASGGFSSADWERILK